MHVASLTMRKKYRECYEVPNDGNWLRFFVTSLRVDDGLERPLKLNYDNQLVIMFAI